MELTRNPAAIVDRPKHIGPQLMPAVGVRIVRAGALRARLPVRDRDVAGILDDLDVGGRVNPLDERKVIPGLDDMFAAQVRQPAVTDQYAQAASIQERLARRRRAVDRDAQSQPVVLRPQAYPFSERPPERLRSTSVNSNAP